MARYPDRRSAAIPALHAVQRRYGWCSPEGIEQAACVMRLTPAYLTAVATFYDMLYTQPVGRHDVYVCTNISCSLCGADELFAAFTRARRRRPRASTSAPSSASARATSRRWPRSTATTSGRSRPTRCPPSLDAVRRGEEPLPERQLKRLQVRRPASAHSLMTDLLLFKDIDEPGLDTLDVYARRGGYEALRKALAMTPRRGPRTSSRPPACAAAAAPASRWARRSRSCPRARWTSTSSATPTSPSPAPSRTASSCRRARTCSSRA